MPSVPATSDSWLKATLNKLQAQITALATTQNQYVLDNNSITRVTVGWHQSDNTYGVSIYDPSGNRRVMLGQLSNGDHGIELFDTTGNSQELLPALDNFVGTTLSTTSASPVTLAGSPAVTINTGASGDCEVTAGASAVNAAGGTGVGYLVIDGGTTHSIFGLGSSVAITANVQSTRRLSTWLGSTLTPNASHTFTMQYSSSSGTSQFAFNYLKVQPL